MKKVAIIGGGASGLVAAISSKTSDNEVVILERNAECGKKILVTGNGRCNYFNSNQDVKHYYSENNNLINNLINHENIDKVISFFEKLGIIPKIRDGYYYPFSNQATTIKNALVNECRRKGIIIKNNFLVSNIEKNETKYIIKSSDSIIEADIVVIATGSFASPKTGSDGMGYEFLKDFNHTIIKPLPALVQLKSEAKYLKDWAGIRTDVELSLYENDVLIKKETGEIQLTSYGISGICTFNLSGIIARGLDKNKKELVKINFLPFLNYEEIDDYIEWFDKYYEKIGNKTVSEILELILNYKLVNVIIKEVGINKDILFNKLSFEDKKLLIKKLIAFEVLIIGTNSYNESQVCSGGVSLEEVNLYTMESKKVENLYITGELLDIVGDCGGYNLTIAWLTGILAGSSIKEKK